MTPDELRQVEQLVNTAIGRNLQVYAVDVPLELAKRINGVRAVFGERYPDPVRVVCIGQPVGQLVQNLDNPEWRDLSIEFCGGTHLQHSGEAERFVVVQETALAAGVRRITALTGDAALEADRHAQDLESRIIRASELGDEALPIECDRIGKHIEEDTLSLTARRRLAGLHTELRERAKALLKQSGAADRDKVVTLARQLAEGDAGPVIVHRVPGADKDTLLVAMDVFRAKRPEAATMLFAASAVEAKVSIVAGVPQELIARGLKAGDWVKQAAQVCGGGGGGRPDMAQAGGKKPEKVDEAITMAREFAHSLLD
jgi:alanyl-tRNA synthetase